MKNLKRALSFAVAAVMLVGMMAVGTSAFTDDADIVNSEAVNVMNQLGIIAGKPDGSFDPTATVTRGEMAKMICVALNGGKTPVLDNAVSTYPDTVGHWAAGYIEYCSSLGIVAGSTDGNFYPNAPITGTEAAKMVAIALGYNAENEKFVNNKDWSTNINVVANKKGLYEDVTSLPGAPISRDNAAQMLYNGMTAAMVEYDYQLTTMNGDLVSVAVAKDKALAPTILGTKFDMGSVTAVLDDVSYDKEDKEYTVALAGGYTFTSDVDYSGLFGQSVKVLFKGDWTDDAMYGLFAKGGKVLATATVADLGAVSGDPGEYKLAIDTVKYDVDFDAIPAAKVNLTAGTIATGSCDAAWTIALIDTNNNKKGDSLVVYPYVVDDVDYVGAKSVTVGGTNYAFEDENVKLYDGIAEEDYVVIIKGIYTVDGDTVVTKAGTLTGEITAYNTTDDTVKVGGEWYNVTNWQGDALAVGTEYDFVVVNGYIYKATETEDAFSAADLVYIVGANAPTEDLGVKTQKVKVLFADGTKAVVTVDKINSEKPDSTYKLEKDTGLYTFKVDTDGNYEISNYAPTNYDFTGSFTTIDEGKTTEGYRFNADAVVFVYENDGDVSVITGADVNKWENVTPATTVVYGETVNGFNYVQLACITFTDRTELPGASTGAYGMVVATPYTIKDGTDSYVQLTVWNGKENVDLVYAGSDDTILAKGDMIKFEADGNEIVTCDKTAFQLSAVMAYDGTYVSLYEYQNDAEYEIDADSVIIYVDSAKSAGVDGGKIALARKDENGDPVYNVYVLGNSDNEIEAMFVDVANEWDL